MHDGSEWGSYKGKDDLEVAVAQPGWTKVRKNYNKCVILTQITTGKAVNAIQTTKHINSIISTPVFSVETIRRILRKYSFKDVVKKKKLLLSVRHRKVRLAFAQKYSIDSGLWRTRRGFSS
jgi:hypothetical protein